MDKDSSDRRGDFSRDAKRAAAKGASLLLDRPVGLPQGGVQTPGGNVLILCAEPGMGKTALLQGLLERRRQEGASIRMLNLVDSSAEGACESLIRFARIACSASSQDCLTVVGIDNVPAPDECDAFKESKAIKRMARSGMQVIIALRPEAGLLAEALPDAICLRSADLVLGDIAPEPGQHTLWGMTHGIPGLVNPARAELASMGAPAPGGRYLASLARLVRLSLRPSLDLEERGLRLAMFLLGSGSRADLLQVLPRLDDDALYWLRRDVPLLGVNRKADGFCCDPLLSEEGIDGCIASLRGILEALQGATGIAGKVAELLARRGDFSRLAKVCTLGSGAQAMTKTIRAWGCELVAVGEAGTVAEALRACEADVDESPLVLDAGAAAVEFAGTKRVLSRKAPAILEVPVELLSSHERRSACDCRLLGAMRRLRSTMEDGSPWTQDASDQLLEEGLSRMLGLHLRARRLLLSGRFHDAYCLLVNGADKDEGSGLARALLIDDFEIAEVMSGVSPDEDDERRFLDASACIARSGSMRLNAYRRALEPALAALAGNGERIPRLEYVSSRAEASGDTLTQAALLLAASAADLHRGIAARAHVRARQAERLAETGMCGWLAGSSGLLDAVARFMMGEKDALAAFPHDGGGNSALGDVAQVLAGAMGLLDTSEPALSVLKPDVFPQDAGWLLCFLSSGLEGISGRFFQALPQVWKESVRQRLNGMAAFFGTRAAGERRRPDAAIAPPSSSDVAGAGSREPGRRVRINVLGGFEVLLDGEVLESRRFHRRKAQELLTLLCSSRSHKVRRYEALDRIWGCYDYVDGLHRIYEATSAIRTAVGAREHDCDPLVSSKSEGTIALNQKVVSTDIDDFVAHAKGALDSGLAPQEVMRHAVAMDGIVQGSFDRSIAGVALLDASRKAELKHLYTNAAVAGSRAALGEGRAQVAEELARSACMSDDLREDAVLCLVKALGALGRTAEIQQVYDGFTRHFVDVVEMPPPQRLRQAVEDELGGRGSWGADAEEGVDLEGRRP